MKPLIVLLFVVSSLLLSAPFMVKDSMADTPKSGEVYVLVHGAWGGSWDWKGMAQRLQAEGHEVYRVALTGHGQRAHLSHSGIDLSLHIQDVVNVIEWDQLQEVVLVGHSYGGMVITGVADRISSRIKKLIYLDAIVPEDGESVNSAFGRASDESSGPGMIKDGFSIPPWVPEGAPVPHDVPHSIKCFEEELSLKEEARFEIPTTYLYFVDPGMTEEQDAFYPFSVRASEYGWNVITLLDWDHNAHRSHPEELLKLLVAE